MQYFNDAWDVAPKRARECFRFEHVALHQRGRNRFVVTYGKQVDDELSYATACAKLGQALMHQAACDDKLDNRMPGER